MQRCFTMFPDRWPGVGLLVLRLTQAITVLDQIVHELLSPWPASTAILLCLGFGCAGLLLLGLWTPIAAGLITLVESALFISAHDSTYLLTAALGLAILMLGPGVWSIDSRLFGRRRILVDSDHLRDG
jgi:hypothetical protein